MEVSRNEPTPIQEMKMYKVQRSLSWASSYPIIGVIPASVKAVVSVTEIVSAFAFSQLLELSGGTLCSAEFAEREIKACENHLTIGGMSFYYSLLGIITVGWGPYFIEEIALKGD